MVFVFKPIYEALVGTSPLGVIVCLLVVGIFKYPCTLALYIEAVVGATAFFSTSLNVNLF